MRTRPWIGVATLIGVAMACSSSGDPAPAPAATAFVAPTSPTTTSTTTPSTPSSPAAASTDGPTTTLLATPAPQTRWAAHLSGPTNEDEIDGVAAAPDGSLYITGKFEQTTTLGGTELVSAGAADIPLARFDADGRPIWVTQFGGPGEDNFFDIDADAAGAVATGIFEGTVQFGEYTLTSAGLVDCAVVAFDPDGSVRWARSFGGPGIDGCNEVTIASDGSIVTSIDTDGGWELPTGPLADSELRDTVLMRLDADGTLQWARRVGGPGPQRGKALAVAPDGSIAFGGESFGELHVEGDVVEVPGLGFDSWLTHWTPDGELDWVDSWGGVGRDFVKGLVHDESSVYAVGPFVGRIDVQGTVLDGGGTTDLLVARFGLDGRLDWATSVQADGNLTGAEVTNAPGGGLLFGSTRPDGLVIRDGAGEPVALDDANGGNAWLATYRSDGSVGWASTIEGAFTASPGEIARVGQRIYLDMTVRDAANSAGGTVVSADRKDSAVWAIDIPD
jgi:hypothetical protein